MSRSYNLGHEFIVFKKSEGKEKLKEILHDICDEDFNGNNGEDYFTTITIGNEEVEISEFDAAWLTVQNKDEKTIIESILINNYGNDGYYDDFNLNVEDRDDEIIFALSYMY